VLSPLIVASPQEALRKSEDHIGRVDAVREKAQHEIVGKLEMECERLQRELHEGISGIPYAISKVTHHAEAQRHSGRVNRNNQNGAHARVTEANYVE
jgi:signal transduction histidine kinase